MPRREGQKLKLLYLQEILRRETDEQHPLSLKQIQVLLEQKGVFAERKSLYDDMEQLKLLGEDIVTTRDTTTRYFIGSRSFDMAQLRLLVDAVQSSKFITKKKSEQLIRDLESLTSRHQAGELQRQVLVSGRIKHMNESIFYNVDALQGALRENRQVKFQYFDWGMDKEQHLRHDGAYYQVSPWALTWDDENYYLIAYDHASASIRHYRVDRMLRIRQIDLPREGGQEFQRLDMAQHTQKTFGMFGGKPQPVTLRCHSRMAGIILDRFGQEITLFPEGEDTFTAHVSVVVSPQFFAWLTGFEGAVQVQSPTEIAQEYRQYLEKILASFTQC